jgi:cyclopropane-fatty-acyl-phospholipid synthase
MSFEDRQTLAHPIGGESRGLRFGLVEIVLRALLRRLEFGQLIIDTPEGRRLTFDGAQPGPNARLKIHNWKCLGRLAAGWDLGLAEAYIAGEVSSPSMAEVLRLADPNEKAADRLKPLRPPSTWGRLRHALNRNTRRGSRRNISAHYDLGNEFYQHWLDAGMTYSAGLFSCSTQTLEDAQRTKLDRVTELLNMAGGEKVLEIGCGWGSLAERLLQQDGCEVTGVTLSTAQHEYAGRRLHDHVTSGRCDLRIEDYREVTGTFDRIVSIEMLEAVGEAYWPVYFTKLRSSLNHGGAAVLQVITIDESRFEDYRRRPDFIQKHIFPGGMLPTASHIERLASDAGLRLVSSEFFGDSYARTLEIWQQRFQQAWPKIKPLGFDERFKRTWEYYLDYCQVGFESAAINVGLYKFT